LLHGPYDGRVVAERGLKAVYGWNVTYEYVDIKTLAASYAATSIHSAEGCGRVAGRVEVSSDHRLRLCPDVAGKRPDADQAGEEGGYSDCSGYAEGRRDPFS
jgi:hypothetical protein